MIYLITADGGHGMDTGGKRTPKFANGTFMHEREFNQAVVELMKKIAATIPDVVFYDVAPENKDVPLNTRISRANAKLRELQAKHGAANVKAVHVSIHANAMTGVWGAANGQETFHHPNSSEGKKLATEIHTELLKGTKLTNRGVKSANFAMVRDTIAPSALVEAGFMDNKKEAELLLSDAFRKEVAQEVIQGIMNYFKKKIDLEPIPNKPEEPIKKFYRVRTSWSNNQSQVGAYLELSKAIEAAKLNPGFNVYDDGGKLVYEDKLAKLYSSFDTLKAKMQKSKKDIRNRK